MYEREREREIVCVYVNVVLWREHMLFVCPTVCVLLLFYRACRQVRASHISSKCVPIRDGLSVPVRRGKGLETSCYN